MATSTASSKRPLTMVSNKTPKQEVSPEIREARKQLVKGLREARIAGKQAYIALPAKLIVDGVVVKEIDINSLQNFAENPLDISTQDIKPEKIESIQNGEIKNEEVKNENVKNIEVKTEEVSIKKEENVEVIIEEVKTEEVKTEEVSIEEVKNEEVSIEEVKNKDVKIEELKNEEVTQLESKIEEVKCEEVSKKPKSKLNSMAAMFENGAVEEKKPVRKKKVKKPVPPPEDNTEKTQTIVETSPISEIAVEKANEIVQSDTTGVVLEFSVPNTSDEIKEAVEAVDTNVENGLDNSMSISTSLVIVSNEDIAEIPVTVTNPPEEPIIETTIEVVLTEDVESSKPPSQVIDSEIITSDINTSEIEKSEINTAEAIQPELNEPEIKPSDLNTPEIIPSEMNTSEIIATEINVPEIIPSEVDNPDCKIEPNFTEQVEAVYESDIPLETDIQAILDADLADIPEEPEELILETTTSEEPKENAEVLLNGDVTEQPAQIEASEICPPVEEVVPATVEEAAVEVAPPVEDILPSSPEVLTQQPVAADINIPQLVEELPVLPEEAQPKPPPYDPVLEGLKFCGELPFDVIGFFLVVVVGGSFAADYFGMDLFFAMVVGIATTPLLVKSVLQGIKDM